MNLFRVILLSSALIGCSSMQKTNFENDQEFFDYLKEEIDTISVQFNKKFF